MQWSCAVILDDRNILELIGPVLCDDLLSDVRYRCLGVTNVRDVLSRGVEVLVATLDLPTRSLL